MVCHVFFSSDMPTLLPPLRPIHPKLPYCSPRMWVLVLPSPVNTFYRSEILWHKSPPQENCLSLCSHIKPFPFPDGFRMAKPNRAHSSWVDIRCGQEFLAKIRTGRVSPPPSPPPIYGWPLGLALRKISKTVTRNWGNTILGTFKTETTRLEVR